MPIHRINVGRSFVSKRLTSSVFKFELDGPEYGGVGLISCCGLGGIRGKVGCDMLKKNRNSCNSVIYFIVIKAHTLIHPHHLHWSGDLTPFQSSRKSKALIDSLSTIANLLYMFWPITQAG